MSHEKTEEEVLQIIAQAMDVKPEDVRGFLVIVHTHPDSEECAQGAVNVACNVPPIVASAYFRAYIERMRGMN